MADGTLQILGLGTSAGTLEYNVSGTQALDLIAVQADFNGSSAVVDYQAVVEIVSDAGEVMARGVGPTITAGGSASVTFAPFLEEEQVAAPPALTLSQVIVALQPDFWYKQGESSGNTANDSTGNGWNATVQPGFAAPAWGQAAGPPTTTAAKYVFASNEALENTTFPSMTGDLTLFTYAKLPTQVGGLGYASLMGQGVTGGQTSNQPGCSIVALAFNQGQTFAGFIGNLGGVIHAFAANTPYVADTWYSVALRRRSGVWSLFQDGVNQTAHYVEGVYSPAAADVWIGPLPNIGSVGQFNSPILSYSMGWGNRALTDAEILSLATTPGP